MLQNFGFARYFISHTIQKARKMLPDKGNIFRAP